MKKIPKPIPCHERWANMTPAAGGRICQSCSKLIVDFRRKSWNEISEIQAENNNTVCGIYSNRQLKHWGQQPPSQLHGLKKTASLVALSSAISVAAYAQTENNTNDLVVYGTITGNYFSKEKEKNIIGPIENAIVRIESLQLETKTDSLGAFSFSIPEERLNDTVIELTTKADSYGEQKVTVNTNQVQNDSLRADQNLNEKFHVLESPSPAMFYAAPPTFKESLKEKVDTLKGKK